METYKFLDLKNLVEKNFGIEVDKTKSKFEPPPKIRVEISQFELNEKIEISDTGIYYKDGNKKIKGFLYIPIFDPQLWASKGWNDMPRFHITNCDTISKQKRRSNFNGHYVFSSEPVTDLSGADGIKKDILLCGYCRRMDGLDSKINSTSYYEDYLLDSFNKGNFYEEDLPEEIDVDKYGYTPDWDETSRLYRIKKNFTCENCGIDLNISYSDGYYLETHHINGNKTDNNDSNLKCLCVLCHSNSNPNHMKNFNHNKNKQKLKDFVNLFKSELIAVNNEYLSDYLNNLKP